ncbi:hypothetical protein AB0L40_22975, partial [Patulibacter sp. NPDC049589]|uniref:hypothetical protein n=1 Tax=Patulibacter sp. NPDC049589 TaxID=3154731 RepID=UPI003428DC6B
RSPTHDSQRAGPHARGGHGREATAYAPDGNSAYAPPAPAAGPAAAPAAAVGLATTDVDELLPGIAEQMGGAVKFALSQARAVSIKGADLILGVPAGKATAARAINREDAKEKIASQLEELLGVRFVIRAEEQVGVEAPEEPLLPEDEVVRRLVSEFEAEEVGDGASGVSSPAEPGDPSSAPESTTRTDGAP